MSGDLHTAIVNLEWEEALAAAERALASGQSPLLIVEECRRALEEVGARFEAGDYFLSELILGAEIFKEVMALVGPDLAAAGGGGEAAGRVVIGTVHGDIHDLGKNVVVALLTASNFEVHDLGVDVPEERFLEAVRAYRPHVTLAYLKRDVSQDRVAAWIACIGVIPYSTM